MVLDISCAGIYFAVNEIDKRGNATQIARGHVKTRGWLTRKIKQYHPQNVIYSQQPARERFTGEAWEKGEVAQPWTHAKAPYLKRMVDILKNTNITKFKIRPVMVSEQRDWGTHTKSTKGTI